MSLLVIVCSQAGLAAENAPAVDPAAVLAPLVSDDTFAVAYVDITRPWLESQNVNRLSALLPHDARDALALLEGAQHALQEFRDAGADAVYLAAGLLDLHISGGPVAIIHVDEAGNVDQVVQLARGLIGSISPVAGNSLPTLEARPVQNTVLVGSSATLDRYTATKPAKRGDLVEPLARMTDDDAAFAVVFSPGPDFRRVVRELWPQMPGPLAPLRSELADRWLRLEASLHPTAEPRARVALETSDEAAAETFVKLWRDLPKLSHERRVQTIVDALRPQREGTRVVINLPSDHPQMDSAREALIGLLQVTQEKAARERRMNQFKQLALAFHNYADNLKHLPPAAIRDANGRPLLSWRVAILPYLEAGDLYKQFHLDEPWDSPHNRELIQKMPEMYADPDRKLRHLAREGKTTFQAPVGPETIFHNDEGATFREITDGTSNTIMIVEVEPLRAVIWTKPEDWEVDLDNPQRGVERPDRKYFVTAFADGSARTIPTDIDPTKLRAHVTRAGKEPIER